MGNTKKDAFYDQLKNTVAKLTNASDILVICGDFSGHIRTAAYDYEVIHDGNGYSQRNSEDDSTFEFSVTQNVVVGQSYFIKNDNLLLHLKSFSVNFRENRKYLIRLNLLHIRMNFGDDH